MVVVEYVTSLFEQDNDDERGVTSRTFKTADLLLIRIQEHRIYLRLTVFSLE